jgi:hypothetical protein
MTSWRALRLFVSGLIASKWALVASWRALIASEWALLSDERAFIASRRTLIASWRAVLCSQRAFAASEWAFLSHHADDLVCPSNMSIEQVKSGTGNQSRRIAARSVRWRSRDIVELTEELKPSGKVVERSPSKLDAMCSVKVVGNMAPNAIVTARVKVQVIE